MLGRLHFLKGMHARCPWTFRVYYFRSGAISSLQISESFIGRDWDLGLWLQQWTYVFGMRHCSDFWCSCRVGCCCALFLIFLVPQETGELEDERAPIASGGTKVLLKWDLALPAVNATSTEKVSVSNLDIACFFVGPHCLDVCGMPALARDLQDVEDGTRIVCWCLMCASSAINELWLVSLEYWGTVWWTVLWLHMVAVCCDFFACPRWQDKPKRLVNGKEAIIKGSLGI